MIIFLISARSSLSTLPSPLRSVTGVASAVLSLLIDLYENHTETNAYPENTESPSEKYVKKVMYYMEYRLTNR